MAHLKILGQPTLDFSQDATAGPDMAATVCHLIPFATRTTSDNAQLEFIWDVCTILALAAIKLSAIFLYRRVFCSVKTATISRSVTMLTGVMIAIYLVNFTMLTFIQCGSHISALWDGNFHQYCATAKQFLHGLVLTDFILNLWVFVMPIPSACVHGIFYIRFKSDTEQIVKMQMPKTNKLPLAFVFFIASQ